jgi:hypothetical protein
MPAPEQQSSAADLKGFARRCAKKKIAHSALTLKCAPTLGFGETSLLHLR